MLAPTTQNYLLSTSHLAARTRQANGRERGQCGACIVLVNRRRRINSCLTLAVMHNNASITTIEGLATSEELHPLQAAFIKYDALQCGYCTPGQICSGVGLLAEGHAQSDAFELDNDRRLRVSGSAPLVARSPPGTGWT